MQYVIIDSLLMMLHKTVNTAEPRRVMGRVFFSLNIVSPGSYVSNPTGPIIKFQPEPQLCLQTELKEQHVWNIFNFRAPGGRHHPFFVG